MSRSVRLSTMLVVSMTSGLCLCGCEGPPQPASTPAPVVTAPSLGGESTRPLPEGFSETASGLRYKVLKEADGKQPTAANTVTVNYRGWLDNGSEFDAGKGISFGLGQVIPGWTEGLQLIGEGGTIELEIPPGLAYGNQDIPGIPAGSTLHFEVDLLSVE